MITMLTVVSDLATNGILVSMEAAIARWLWDSTWDSCHITERLCEVVIEEESFSNLNLTRGTCTTRVTSAVSKGYSTEAQSSFVWLIKFVKCMDEMGANNLHTTVYSNHVSITFESCAHYKWWNRELKIMLNGWNYYHKVMDEQMK